MTNEELVLQIQAGINRKNNLEQLYEQNLPLIRMIVKPYTRVFEEDDLMQEAFIGLMDAADRWDADKGYLFMSYAPWCIKTVIYRQYNSGYKEKRIPEFMVHRIKQYRQFIKDYEQQYGEKPSKETINHYLGIDTGQYDLMINTIAEAEIVSIHESIGDDLTLEDTIIAQCDCEMEVVDACMKDSLWDQVDKLPSLESDLLHLKFQEERSEQEIADLKNINLNAVKAAQQRAYRRLRNRTMVRRIAEEYGCMIGSRPYKDGLTKFRGNSSSQVEIIAVENLSRQERQNSMQKRADILFNEIMQIV